MKEGKRFAAVNGVILKHHDKNSQVSQIDLQDHKHKIDNKRKMYISEYEMNLQTRLKIPSKNILKYDSCDLVDPSDPSLKPLHVTPGDGFEIINAHQKRGTITSIYNAQNRSTTYYEHIKLIAYEGSGLTLLGTLSYDAETDTFKMTDVASMLSGGFKEGMKYMQTQIATWKAGVIVMGTLTASLLFATGFMAYQRY